MVLKAMHSQALIQEFFQNRWVLVIEPANNYRVSIKQFLANMKINNVFLAASPAEAQKKLRFSNESWALLISEWNLPRTNGLQLCRNLRKEEKFKDLAFLLTSVENMKRDVVLASEVGVDGYLLKPFSYEEFLSQMETIARSRMRVTEVNRVLDEAESALAAGEHEKASGLFRDALVLKPDSARALHGLARIALAEDKKGEALSLVEKAVARNPAYMEAWRTLLQMREDEQNTEEVLRVALQLHKVSPDNPSYVLKIAMAYLEMRKLDESEESFRKAIRLSPKLAQAFKGLGDVACLREDYERAMENYHKALDLDANDSSILNAMALTQVRLGKVKEGISKYQAALRIDPDNPGILFNLGYAFERTGEFEQAKTMYRKALMVMPSFEKPQRALERLARKGSDPQPPK